MQGKCMKDCVSKTVKDKMFIFPSKYLSNIQFSLQKLRVHSARKLCLKIISL